MAKPIKPYYTLSDAASILSNRLKENCTLVDVVGYVEAGSLTASVFIQAAIVSSLQHPDDDELTRYCRAGEFIVNDAGRRHSNKPNTPAFSGYFEPELDPADVAALRHGEPIQISDMMLLDGEPVLVRLPGATWEDQEKPVTITSIDELLISHASLEHFCGPARGLKQPVQLARTSEIQECKHWLTRWMSESVEKPHPKAQIERLAREKYPHLNRSGFNTAWREANQLVPKAQWDKPGAPRKPRKENPQKESLNE